MHVFNLLGPGTGPAGRWVLSSLGVKQAGVLVSGPEAGEDLRRMRDPRLCAISLLVHQVFQVRVPVTVCGGRKYNQSVHTINHTQRREKRIHSPNTVNFNLRVGPLFLWRDFSFSIGGLTFFRRAQVQKDKAGRIANGRSCPDRPNSGQKNHRSCQIFGTFILVPELILRFG